MILTPLSLGNQTLHQEIFLLVKTQVLEVPHSMETQETEVYVETFGGDPAHRVIVAPQKLDNLSVDLSSWLNSLSNRNSYTIIDITSGFNEGEGGSSYPFV